jgi:hypothetical protein
MYGAVNYIVIDEVRCAVEGFGYLSEVESNGFEMFYHVCLTK